MCGGRRGGLNIGYWGQIARQRSNWQKSFARVEWRAAICRRVTVGGTVRIKITVFCITRKLVPTRWLPVERTVALGIMVEPSGESIVWRRRCRWGWQACWVSRQRTSRSPYCTNIGTRSSIRLSRQRIIGGADSSWDRCGSWRGRR